MHYFFIPVFNELRSISTIEHNIITARYVTTNIHFLISDNCSDDGTYEELLRLKTRYNKLITLHRNERNIGFARNLVNVRLMPPKSLISIVGANDYLCAKGFAHLRRTIRKNPEVEMFIANWAYFKRNPKGRRKRTYQGDVSEPFIASTLEDYFKRTTYVPNGIMQFTARRELLLNIEPYAEQDFKNPQLGAFVDSFPCMCMCIGKPALCEVEWIEAGGWRQHKDTVVKAHEQIADEIRLLLKSVASRNGLPQSTMMRICDIYCQTPVRALFSGWGTWQAPVLKRRYLRIPLMYTWRCTTFRGKIKLVSLTARLALQRLVATLQGLFNNDDALNNTKRSG